VGDLGSCEFLPDYGNTFKYAGGCVTAERDDRIREKAVLLNYVIC